MGAEGLLISMIATLHPFFSPATTRLPTGSTASASMPTRDVVTLPRTLGLAGLLISMIVMVGPFSCPATASCACADVDGARQAITVNSKEQSDE